MIARVAWVALVAACGFENRATDTSFDAPPIVPDGGPCTKKSATCASPDILRTCGGAGETYVDAPCSWGCMDDGDDSRCGEIEPHANVVTSDDLKDMSSLAPLVLGADYIVNGATGEIGTAATPDMFRPSGVGVKNGIEFELRGNAAAVFRARGLMVTGNVLLTGTRAIAIVTDDAIVIGGVVDARGRCTNLGQNVGGEAGPGGFQGGAKKANAGGSGGGTGGGTSNTDGGGGGGHGGTGGIGGGASMAAGGTPFDAAVMMLIGGGGGGGGGGGNGNTQPGGGGGGALQLVSNTRIEITAAGGINAGGCGGFSTTGPDSGGGGGAGGTILLEAPSVLVVGALAVNGGGGGAGENPATPQGEHGRLDRVPAAGATGMGNGGAGGAGAVLDGTAGTMNTKSGGGGGAVGRIHINTRGDLQLVVNTAAVLSPNFEDPATTCTRGSAVVR